MELVKGVWVGLILVHLLGSGAVFASEVTAVTPNDSTGAAYLGKAAKDLATYCFRFVTKDDKYAPEADKDVCTKLTDALKAQTELNGSSVEKAHTLARTEKVDARSLARDNAEDEWGRRWCVALWICDGIVAVILIVIIVGVCRQPDASSVMREPTTAPGAGKLSFGRLVGIVGGGAALMFVVFVTNVCLSHLFVTGKMPDQLGTTYATAVGTFLTALVPYFIGKVNH